MMSKNLTPLGLKARLQMVSKQLFSSLEFRKNRTCKKNEKFDFISIVLKLYYYELKNLKKHNLQLSSNKLNQTEHKIIKFKII